MLTNTYRYKYIGTHKSNTNTHTHIHIYDVKSINVKYSVLIAYTIKNLELRNSAGHMRFQIIPKYSYGWVLTRTIHSENL